MFEKVTMQKKISPQFPVGDKHWQRFHYNNETDQNTFGEGFTNIFTCNETSNTHIGFSMYQKYFNQCTLKNTKIQSFFLKKFEQKTKRLHEIVIIFRSNYRKQRPNS